jgi:hypothetical protein
MEGLPAVAGKSEGRAARQTADIAHCRKRDDHRNAQHKFVRSPNPLRNACLPSGKPVPKLG